VPHRAKRIRLSRWRTGGKVFASFEDENLLSARREPLRERRAAADYDQIVFVHHSKLLNR
jgi:hypothetical protein